MRRAGWLATASCHVPRSVGHLTGAERRDRRTARCRALSTSSSKSSRLAGVVRPARCAPSRDRAASPNRPPMAGPASPAASSASASVGRRRRLRGLAADRGRAQPGEGLGHDEVVRPGQQAEDVVRVLGEQRRDVPRAPPGEDRRHRGVVKPDWVVWFRYQVASPASRARFGKRTASIAPVVVDDRRRRQLVEHDQHHGGGVAARWRPRRSRRPRRPRSPVRRRGRSPARTPGRPARSSLHSRNAAERTVSTHAPTAPAIDRARASGAGQARQHLDGGQADEQPDRRPVDEHAPAGRHARRRRGRPTRSRAAGRARRRARTARRRGPRHLGR